MRAVIGDMQRVPGLEPLFVDADPIEGDVLLYRGKDDKSPVCMSVQQSESLRRLLERAEDVVSTGIGKMEDP